MPFSLSRCLLKSHPSRIVGLVAAHHPTSPTPRTRARLCFYCPSPSNPTRKYSTAMAETSDAEAVKIMAEPASKECEILAGNKAREEALKEKEEDKEEEKLPKLSAADFRVYNSMAEHMEYFHNHFRQSWTMLYNSCVNNKRPQGLSLKQFISTGLQLCSHLGTHHSIEEMHIFPVLARKMPEFKQGKNAAELLRQHKEIHHGMDVFEAYLEKCRSGETELELRVLKEKMDTWGDVLWKHLDQEVQTLGAENMRKYWTLDEMRRMPM